MRNAYTAELRIRKAQRADGRAFLGLVVALARFEKLAPPDSAARRRLLADAFGKRPRFSLWVAELDERVVAYAIHFLTYSSFLARPTLYLEDLFVHPDARGRGVATAMMRALALEALRLRCGRFEWTVLDWNVRAIRLYRGLGAKQMKAWIVCRVTGPALKRLATRPK